MYEVSLEVAWAHNVVKREGASVPCSNRTIRDKSSGEKTARKYKERLCEIMAIAFSVKAIK